MIPHDSKSDLPLYYFNLVKSQEVSGNGDWKDPSLSPVWKRNDAPLYTPKTNGLAQPRFLFKGEFSTRGASGVEKKFH